MKTAIQVNIYFTIISKCNVMFDTKCEHFGQEWFENYISTFILGITLVPTCNYNKKKS